MSNLKRAIEITRLAHKGQVDKGGNDYFLHLERVMSKFSNETDKIIAVLHDIVEDTHITFEDLRNEGFSEEIVSTIDNLTRRENETYDEFLFRVKQHSKSIDAKIEDMKDNMDLSRIPVEKQTKQDRRRVKKYEKKLKILQTDDYIFSPTKRKWILKER